MGGSPSQGLERVRGVSLDSAWDLRSRMYRLNHDAGSSPTHPKETMMRFYTGQHRFYCGIDLHTRTLSLCVLDSSGTIALEATLSPEPERLLNALAVPRRLGHRLRVPL